MTTTPSGSNPLSTSSSTRILRPRTKRLISGLSEGDETAPETFDSPPRRIASPVPSPFDSRSASPIPAAHPQRSSLTRTRDDGAERYAGYSSWGRRAQVGAASAARNARGGGPTTSLAGLWGNGWTTLQGLATELLSGEAPAPAGNGSLRVKDGRVRTSSAGGRSRDRWGPTSNPQTEIGTGTKESRENAVRAAKRKDMLTGGDSNYHADAMGKMKRRLSDEAGSRSAPPGENDERAALVYIHHVMNDDTLAGITIKYNCSAAVVRKANRMWPNDTVQSRQTIMLPVDACGVKGRPVTGPEAAGEVDLLAGDVEETDSMAVEEVETPKAIEMNGNAFPHPDARSSTSSEPQWHHDSWALLPHSTQPTEIARLSRRALGYFPPARRKSLTLSSNPSIDIPRPSIDTIESTDATPRPRRLSNAASGYYPSYLAGPGGVGTMRPNVRAPGPAQDGLNKIFAKHLPDVAPPPNTIAYDGDGGIGTPSLLPQAGLINLENVGGAIEGWMRRVVAGGKGSGASETKGVGPRTSVGAPGKGRGGIGDLIEMVGDFELGADDESEDEDRGREYLAQQRDYYDGQGGSSATAARGGRKSGKND